MINCTTKLLNYFQRLLKYSRSFELFTSLYQISRNVNTFLRLFYIFLALQPQTWQGETEIRSYDVKHGVCLARKAR